MPFVHVVGGDPGFQLLQDQIAADAQHRFLADPGVFVSAVEILSDEPIFRGIQGQIGVEEVNVNASLHPGVVIFPDPDVNLAVGNVDGDLEGQRFHEGARIEIGIHLFLLAKGIDALDEVAALVEQGDAHQGDIQIGHRFDVVTGQDPQTAAVGGDMLIESDFHAEIGNFHGEFSSCPILQVLMEDQSLRFSF